MSTTIDPAKVARRELGTGFDGELVGPGDPDYDTARALFNAMIDKRPAVIARCSSAAGLRRGRRADVLADRADRGGPRRIPRVPAHAVPERDRLLLFPHGPAG